MRLVALDWVAIGAYLAFAMGVGLWLTKRASRGTQDFYLAGRSLKWWVAGTSLVATSFAADTPLVVTGWVRTGGISQNWLWWGMAVGHSLVAIVLAGWWRRAEVTTDAEFIERRYSGREARVLRGFYGGYHALVTNTIVLVWVLTAMKKVVRVVLDLPDGSQDLWILGGALILALTYSFMSGLWGVVVTDFFQFFLALLGALVLAWRAVEEFGGLDGFREALTTLPAKTIELVPGSPMPQDGFWASAAQVGWWTSGFGMFLIFTAVQGWLNKNADGGGHGIQRFSACRDEGHARGAALWFTLAHYCVRPWPWIVVALASLLLVDPEMLPLQNGAPDHEAAYAWMMAEYLGPGLFGVMCASFVAAFMSTLDTHFNLASAYLVNDLYKRFLRPGRSERHYVWVGRWCEVLIGVAACLLALAADSISELFTLSLSLLGGLGPAILMRWFWWRANPWTEISALATSTLMTVLTTWDVRFWLPTSAEGCFLGPLGELGYVSEDAYHRPPWLSDLDYPLNYVLIVFVSLLMSVVVTLLTKPSDAETLRAFHARVRPVGWWRPVAGPLGPEGRRQVLAILGGWAGGALLVYGLLLGLGHWLVGSPSFRDFSVALAGAFLLVRCWGPALPPREADSASTGDGGA